MMIGESKPFLDLRFQLRKAATWNREPVLLLGERGVGKDLAARMLHLWSER